MDQEAEWKNQSRRKTWTTQTGSFSREHEVFLGHALLAGITARYYPQFRGNFSDKPPCLPSFFIRDAPGV